MKKYLNVYTISLVIITLLCVFLLVFLFNREPLENDMTAPVSSSENAEEQEQEKERKYQTVVVEVIEIKEDCFILEDTKGVRYQINASYNQGYMVGEHLYLEFERKEQVSWNLWEVTPVHLYVDSLDTSGPMNFAA